MNILLALAAATTAILLSGVLASTVGQVLKSIRQESHPLATRGIDAGQRPRYTV